MREAEADARINQFEIAAVRAAKGSPVAAMAMAAMLMAAALDGLPPGERRDYARMSAILLTQALEVDGDE